MNAEEPLNELYGRKSKIPKGLVKLWEDIMREAIKESLSVYVGKNIVAFNVFPPTGAPTGFVVSPEDNTVQISGDVATLEDMENEVIDELKSINCEITDIHRGHLFLGDAVISHIHYTAKMNIYDVAQFLKRLRWLYA